VQINPRTTAKDIVKMLEDVSISTVKGVQYRHTLKGRPARKQPLLQNLHEKARLQLATAHRDKEGTFWRYVLWSDLNSNFLAIMTIVGIGGESGRLASQRTPSQS
jgi:hypothetical protein